MKEKNIFKGIIVSDNDLITNAEKALIEINLDKDYHLEYFKMDDLLVNISKHELVPKHEIVDEATK